MCNRVADEFQPEKIILFGSYASGIPNEDSDIDVLVVMPLRRGQRRVRPAAAIRTRVPASFPMDVIVRSPHEIALRLGRGDGFVADIVSRGHVMYDGKHG